MKLHIKKFSVAAFIILIAVFLVIVHAQIFSGSGKKLEIQGTDAFSAEAYLKQNSANDDYTIDCTITNLTPDELSVNFYEQFFLSYESNMTNPTSNPQIETLTFLPKEKKSFSFDVDSYLAGEENDKLIYGSCVIEITNNKNYDYFNVLNVEPYVIERS